MAINPALIAAIKANNVQYISVIESYLIHLSNVSKGNFFDDYKR